MPVGGGTGRWCVRVKGMVVVGGLCIQQCQAGGGGFGSKTRNRAVVAPLQVCCVKRWWWYWEVVGMGNGHEDDGEAAHLQT